MDMGRVDYASTTPPTGYRCTTCGRHGCKLWREYQTFADHTELVCCDCAGKSQSEDVRRIDKHGNRPSEFFTRRDRRRCARQNSGRGRRGARPVAEHRTDQIGLRVPAVPTEEGDTFWSYSSVPPEGVAWWRGLPTRAIDGARA